MGREGKPPHQAPSLKKAWLNKVVRYYCHISPYVLNTKTNL